MPCRMKFQMARVEMDFGGGVPFTIKIAPENEAAESFEKLYRAEP